MSDSPRLCGICRENPVGPAGQACPECFARIDHTAKTNPYWRWDDKTQGERGDKTQGEP